MFTSSQTINKQKLQNDKYTELLKSIVPAKYFYNGLVENVYVFAFFKIYILRLVKNVVILLL